MLVLWGRLQGVLAQLRACASWPQAYFMLDEMLLAGELQEPSKKAVTRVIEAQDQLVEHAKAGGPATAVGGLSAISVDRSSRAYS